jgi:hypothetical protein
MKLIDYTLRLTVPGLGIDIRWLKELLEARQIKIRLTDSCVEELAEDAEIAAWRITRGSKSHSMTYLECLRDQLVMRADFVQTWTGSDDKIDEHEETNVRLVRIARKYALPRPWKLTEPVASEWHRPKLVWRWPAHAVSAQPMPQT